MTLFLGLALSAFALTALQITMTARRQKDTVRVPVRVNERSEQHLR